MHANLHSRNRGFLFGGKLMGHLPLLGSRAIGASPQRKRVRLVAMFIASLTLAACGAPQTNTDHSSSSSNHTSVSGKNGLLSVSALTRDNVWAVGGGSHNADDHSHALIAHWNGKSWTSVPAAAIDSSSSNLSGIFALAPNDIWAVGDYAPAGDDSASRTLVEHWDGSAWTLVPSPNPGTGGQFTAIAGLASDDIWAVGGSDSAGAVSQTLVEHWNGSAWTILSSPNPDAGGFLNSVSALSADDIWTAGTTGANEAALVEHWDGSAWTIIPAPSPGITQLNGLSGGSHDSLFAVGSAGSSDKLPQTLIEHWNGASWEEVSGASVDAGGGGDLDGIALQNPNDIWAVGDIRLSDETTIHTLIEHWDGSSWQIISSPSPGAGLNILSSVTIVSATDIWAVGDYETTTSDLGPSSTLIEHWDGSGWTFVNSPNVG